VILATVSSDSGFHGDVRAALDSRFRFETLWDLGYEDAARLQGLKAEQECLSIIDFSNPRALPLARALSGRSQIITIAVGSGSTRDEMLQLMQAGIRDVLPHFTARDLVQSVNRALALVGSAGEVVADMYAFVPAKPGCGATTIATYAAGMAACVAEDPVLLLDFDIRLGVTSFLLKSQGSRTIVDALDMVKRLDRDLWASLVSQIGDLHLLGSGAADFSRAFPPEPFRDLLNFAVRQYAAVAVDLPGSMEEHECEVLQRSKRIFMVSTPDIGALHVARRKSQWLQEMRLADKVSVVLNCVEKRNTLSVKEIEGIIQLPVRYLLPTDTKSVTKAVQDGQILNPDCALGRQIAAIAGEMVPAKTVIKKSSPVRKFVEYFSVSPVRDARGA
jgi:pilus assembly protein CpaE